MSFTHSVFGLHSTTSCPGINSWRVLFLLNIGLVCSKRLATSLLESSNFWSTLPQVNNCHNGSIYYHDSRNLSLSVVQSQLSSMLNSATPSSYNRELVKCCLHFIAVPRSSSIPSIFSFNTSQVFILFLSLLDLTFTLAWKRNEIHSVR